MSLWLKISLAILGAVVVAFGGMAVAFSYSVTNEEMSRKFIVANPLDLSQVVALSQYRSCAGHDFRDPTAEDGKVESTPRSMKHYVKVRPEFRGSIDAVSAFAPFDGVISVIDEDLGGPNDLQIWLTPDTVSPWQWQFIFFHINLDPSLRKGSSVKAGQEIGTANLARGPEGATDNFDVAVKFTRPLHRPAVDSPYAHASASVLKEYENNGIRLNDLVISEELRDANPCPVLPKGIGGDGPDLYFPPEAASEEYIFLKQKAMQ